MSPDSAASVQDLLTYVRDFIQHPRRIDPLLKNKPGWNMLASAMDVVSDTEWAIRTFEDLDVSDKGILYLVIYGLLQAMYVQQDGLESMVRAFTGDDSYKIYQEPEAEFIRRVRHDAVGHPTKQGGIKPRNGHPGEQISYHIVQHSMGTKGFTLLRASNLTGTSFIDVSIQDLIGKNRALAVRVLTRTKMQLETIEMEHRNSFKGEKLADFFPSQIRYYFEKIFSAIHSASYNNRPMGEIGLKMVVDALSGFRAALANRGILNDSSHYYYELDRADYALTELHNYFKGRGLLTDPRAALIFVHFAKDKMNYLRRVAEELDEEYQEDISSA
jgi:hypothetical protein